MKQRDTQVSGLAFALASALTFGTAGAFGRGLLDAGWSPGAVVLGRVWIASVALLPLGLYAINGRLGLLRAEWKIIALYGAAPIAATQLFYFNAIAHMEVGLALLIEYTAPVGVIAWLWLRHGVRPTRRTAFGTLWCAAGLLLMLDVLNVGSVSWVGVGWAFLAMLGATSYFVLSARTDTQLPPMALGAFGLLAGAVTLSLASLAGLVRLDFARTPVTYELGTVAWWWPLLGRGVVSAAMAYTTGIAAGRRLGSRLASFLALLEVVFSVLFAWILVAEMPSALQLFGGALILLGIVIVKLGEPAPRAEPTLSERPAVV